MRTQGLDSEPVTLIGTIEVAAHDLDGSVLAVNIKTPDGKEYLVDDTPTGYQLNRHLGKTMRVEGHLRREPGMTIVTVDRYRKVH